MRASIRDSVIIRRAAVRACAAMGLASGLLGALPQHAQAQAYRYLGQFGVSGQGTLNFPNEVQIDPATRNVYVTDAGNNRVVVFDSSGNFLSTFGSPGTGDGQFDYPAGIGIDPVSHHVIVADYAGHRVETFTSGGTYLSQFAPNDSWTPCAIAIRPGNRDILVSDGYGGTVRVYDVNQGYLGQFGSTNNFGYACDMAIGANGHIFVADETNNNVQIFDAAGGYLGQFGGYGSSNGKMSSPGGIAFDSTTGNLVVADYGNNRIQVFDAFGNYLSQFGSFGSGPGQFDGPVGLAIDPVTHDLLVDDRGNDRIQKFAGCGPTQVNLSTLPQTQALNQEVFFSASIGNVVSPSGIVSIYSEGSLICSAVTYGDPQASCSGNLALGMHPVTAFYSGSGAIPSGCSDAVVVTIVDDTALTATNAFLLVSPADPASRLQGQPITLTGSFASPPLHAPSGTTATYTGFFTFYDGSNVLAQVPLSANQAQFTNLFTGGSHQFSAVYSGDGASATSSANDTISVIVPASDIFYDGFEVPPGG